MAYHKNRATHERIAPAVELLKRKQPAFYAALREPMRVDDAPGPLNPDAGELKKPAAPEA